MACNDIRTIILNNLCDCNNGNGGNNGAGGNEGETPKKKYLDQYGAKFLLQLLFLLLAILVFY